MALTYEALLYILQFPDIPILIYIQTQEHLKGDIT